MTHKLATGENFDIVRGNQTVRVPFAAADPQSAQVVMLADKGDLALKLDAESAFPAFSAASTYAVGDVVTHEGGLYVCSTAVETAGPWDADDWTATTVAAGVKTAIDEAIQLADVIDDGLVPTEGPGTSEVLYSPTSSPTIQKYLSDNYPGWSCSTGPATPVIVRNRKTSEYHVNYDSALYPNMFVFWVQGGDAGSLDSSFFTRDVTFPANGVYSVEVTFSPAKTGSALRYPAVGLSYGGNTLWHYGIRDWSMLQTARFEIKASAGTGTLKFLTENGHSGWGCGFVFSHVKVTLIKEIGIEIGDIVAPDADAQTGQAADAKATYGALHQITNIFSGMSISVEPTQNEVNALMRHLVEALGGSADQGQ